MRGAALWFAEQLARDAPADVDVVLTSDMLSVTDLRSLSVGGLGDVPVVCYFHENQLTYPLVEESERDYQYGFTNISSCLASDAVWFNSRFHQESFLKAAEGLLRKMPDHVPTGLAETLRRKSSVYYPLVELEGVDEARRARTGRAPGPLRILWNHRWEYDKNPEAFFEAMLALDEAGADFRLVVVGEQFRESPAGFELCTDRLRHRVESVGYVETRQDYINTLAGCDVVVSTAIQENFGISVVEAVAAGCCPVLPKRLSYPELLPESAHPRCLYASDGDLTAHLQGLMHAPREMLGCAELSGNMVERFGAGENVERYDRALEAIAERGSR